MISIRKSTFETNSSSTHAMAIPKHVDDYDRRIFKSRYEYSPLVFETEYFGWEIKKVDHINYLYTAICEYCTEYVPVEGVEPDKYGYIPEHRVFTSNYDKTINYIKNVFEKNGIKCKFSKPDLANDWGGIDHAGELDAFLEAVFESEDSLLRYLIHGLAYTGTDNIQTGDIKIGNLDFGPEFDTYHKDN